MVKQHTLGITREVIWERLGYSPTKISRMEAMQTADSLLAPADSADGAAGAELDRQRPAQAVAA